MVIQIIVVTSDRKTFEVMTSTKATKNRLFISFIVSNNPLSNKTW